MSKNIMELVRQKKQQLAQQSGRREKTVKPNPGKNRFRILPGWRGNGDPTFFHDFGQHFVKNLKGEMAAVYVCLDKTYGKPCPICEAIATGIVNASDDDTVNALKNAKGSARVLMNALHLDGEDPATPVIVELSGGTFSKVLDLMDEYGDITDPDEGTDIIINRAGKGLNTEYTVMAASKSAPVSKAVLKSLHDLDAYVAQEYQEGETKAIAAVRSVAGLLPAPAGGQSEPAQRRRQAAVTDFDEDVPASVTGGSTIDGEYSVAEPAPAARKAAAAEDISDDELDDLLSDLG